MDNYIRKYDNVVTDDFCDGLIEKFEDHPEQQEKLSQGLMSLTHLEMMRPDTKIWNKDVMHLVDVFKKYVTVYKNECKIEPVMWPDKYLVESFRIKRYLPNDTDQFGPHVDSKDANSCKRFLAFFLYLDNNDGGSTMFPQMDITSKCKKGSLLVFPPLWPWLHEGKKPIDKPKYIVGSYLKYV